MGKKKYDEKNSNKIIHYFWFGGNPLSDLTKKCIESWKKYLPDFEIKAWDENNFDVNQCTFVKEAYEQKKWAFVADYARFKALEEYGGLYLDTDMEITADISKYLEHDLFLGCEDSKMINAAVVWAKEKNNKHISDIVKFYESMEKFNPTGDLYEMSVPRVLTAYFEKYGFNRELEEVQALDNNTAYIYPMEYFYPLSYDYQHNKFTDNSCMIHHFDATWISKMEKFKTNMKRKNMKWVVYIIDFFISLKNKIKFFSNYRDITIFITMFLVMLLAMFSFIPISQNSTSIFSFLNENVLKSVLQIVVTSAIWTFMCAKVRNIHLNKYCEKITNTDTSNEEYKEIKLNLEQTLKFYKREKIIYIIQMILTLFIAFYPVFEILTIVPQSGTLYLILNMANMYLIYVGIKKNFKYRILELVTHGVILALMIIVKPALGILTSILSFCFVMYKITKNKIKLKRKKSFIISYSVAVLLALVLNFSIPNMNRFERFDFTTSFTGESVVTHYENYKVGEEITEFEAGKKLFGRNFEKLAQNNILFNLNLYLVLSIILIAGITAITRKYEYFYFVILSILNISALTPVEIFSSLNLMFINFVVILIFMVESIIDKVLNKD